MMRSIRGAARRSRNARALDLAERGAPAPGPALQFRVDHVRQGEGEAELGPGHLLVDGAVVPIAAARLDAKRDAVLYVALDRELGAAEVLLDSASLTWDHEELAAATAGRVELLHLGVVARGEVSLVPGALVMHLAPEPGAPLPADPTPARLLEVALAGWLGAEVAK